MRHVLLGLMTLTALIGCGGERMGRVVGTVTYRGEPVTSGIVQFIPKSGPMAAGGLNAQGRFTLTTLRPGDGALSGPHTVCVIPFYPAASDMPIDTPQPDPKNIPNRYRFPATSPLTQDVKAGVTNEVTIELMD